MNIEPGIYRPEFPMDSNFTMVPNALIRDDELPASAKMLLIYLLSHKIGYQILDSQIVREIGMGREALRTARKHLEAEGFISLERVRNDDKSLGAYRYELQDPRGWFSTVGQPTVGEPTVGEATVGNPPDNIKLIPNKTNLNNTRTKKTNDSDFDVFWSIYPKKDDKPLAIRAFKNAVKRASLDVIIAGAERYRDDLNRDDGFTKNAGTWLNNDAWENGPIAPRISRQPRKLTNAEHGLLLVQKYREQEAARQAQPKELDYDMGLRLKGVDDE